jgi:outer membrane protein TolC
MTVLNLVQQGYYDLAAAWDNLQTQQELLATREQFLRVIERQIELGTMTVLEQRVAESQLAKVRTDLFNSSNFVALAANNLKTLMGVTSTNWNDDWYVPREPVVVVGQVFDRTESWQRGLSHRPDLSQLAKGLENAELTRRFNRNQLFPSLDVIGSYGRRGASSVQAFPPDDPSASRGEAFDQLTRGDAPSDMLGLVFSIPLTRTLERANYRASKELKKQAELLVKQKEELILREVSDAIQNAQSNLDGYRSARLATEAARGALKAEEEKLAGGKSSINFVLQYQADLATAHFTENLAKQNYLKAVSQLQFAEGSILERNNITIEFK